MKGNRSCRTQKAAAIASQALLHSERNDIFHVEPAPGPDEINWQALWKTPFQKKIRAAVVWPLMSLLIAFPLGVFAGSLSRQAPPNPTLPSLSIQTRISLA